MCCVAGRSQLTGKQFDLIPHTGIEVYGVEYFFGGGVQALPPATVEATFGLKPCEVLPLGSTAIPKEVFEDFLKEIAPRFTSETYNLFTHNCNNFSNELAQFLLGEGIPSRIVDMPQVRVPTFVVTSTDPALTIWLHRCAYCRNSSTHRWARRSAQCLSSSRRR